MGRDRGQGHGWCSSFCIFSCDAAFGRQIEQFSGFNSDVADTSYQVIAGFLALLHGEHFDGIGLVMGPQDELMGCGFDVFDGAGFVFEDGVHIGFAFAVGLERVVMAVDEKRGTGQETGVHAHAFVGIGFDQDKALPASAVALDFGL